MRLDYLPNITIDPASTKYEAVREFSDIANEDVGTPTGSVSPQSGLRKVTRH